MQGSDHKALWKLENQEYWLLAIGTGLVLIHLTLTARANDDSLLASSLLYWLATASLVWSRKKFYNFQTGFFSSVLGLLCIGLVLLKSAFIASYDPFLRVAPVLSALGLALLASGISGLKQYWHVLLALSFLAPPPTALAQIINLSPVTAQFSTMVLWYSGFDAVRQGVHIFLPEGGIEVVAGCSGIDNMLHLLGLSILFLLLFEIRQSAKVWVPIVALILAFIVNGARVSLMAYLVAASGKDVFEYWHKGEGSLIFSMISVGLFGIFCWFVVCHAEAAPAENVMVSESSENPKPGKH